MLQARLLKLPSVDALVNPQAPATVRQFVEREYLDHVRTNLAPGTSARYVGLWGTHVRPAFGSMTLREVKAADVQKYADRRLRAGARPASVYQEVCSLSGVFREALKADLVERKPVKLVKKPRIENTVVRFLSPEEEANLLAHAAPWLRPAIVISIHSGLRAGELRRLAWADVSFERGTLTIRHTKSKRDRVVPMNATLRETLTAIPRRLHQPCVLTGPISGKAMNWFNGEAWRTALKRAGVERFRWHDLRHTFASRLAQAGVPILAIKQLLGHTTLAMAMRYAHLQEKNLREAVGVLDPARKSASSSIAGS
ncbi:MAG: site-specific integrase [Planctomycetia bacterium]|nr:site-specific integrase [Planctomycetia bacterium]